MEFNAINTSCGRYDYKLVMVGGIWLFLERIINIHCIHRIAEFDELS